MPVLPQRGHLLSWSGTRTRREGHTSPLQHAEGSIPHGDITKSQESPQDLQPPTSLWCHTGDTGWLRTAFTTWEVTAGDTMWIKPCSQEYIQEDPSLKGHPSVPTTPSLIQTPLPTSLHAQGSWTEPSPMGLCHTMGLCHPVGPCHTMGLYHPVGLSLPGKHTLPTGHLTKVDPLATAWAHVGLPGEGGDTGGWKRRGHMPGKWGDISARWGGPHTPHPAATASPNTAAVH